MAHHAEDRTLSTDILGKPMVASATRTPIPAIEQFVRDYYGLSVQAQRSDNERDQQFMLSEPSGRRFILKVSNRLEIPEAIDLQTRALQHVAQVAPQLPTPRVVASLDGRFILPAPWPDDAGASVRLLTYLRGQVLQLAPRSAEQARQLGAQLAHLGLALKDFSHPADRREMPWNLARAARVLPLLDAVEVPAQRALAERHLQYFESEIAPALGELRSQVIHNDFNAHNVLVDEANPDRPAGILDFGDMVRTQLITDVAIGAAYWVTSGTDALQLPHAFVSAYNSVTPLHAEELALLAGLIAARFAVTVAITHWRAQRFPANRAYITKNTATAWRGLALLDALDRTAARRAFMIHCEAP